MDKRILSLAAALLSAGVFAVSRRFLAADPMETFVPALSGLGFILFGLLVFELLFAHMVPAAWATLAGLCAFGWLLMLWPQRWAECWIAASAVSVGALAWKLAGTKQSSTRALLRKVLWGQATGLLIVATVFFLNRSGMARIGVNLFSPAVLLFPLFLLLGLRDANLKKSQSYIVQSAKRDTFESLVQGLAHELNNPLNFIYANIEPLKELVAKVKAKSGDEVSTDWLLEMDRVLDTMEEGAVRARGLVDRFRDFPSGEAEAKEEVDLNRVVDQSVEMLAPKWKDRLKVERRFGDLPKIPGHPLQLAQVFTNLIANACDATPDGGVITVSTQRGATGAKVSVKDTGHGIPKERVPRIFDPFYTTKEQGKGTGLGLAITLQLVKNHKGGVEVKSEVGKGSEFLVSLPYS